MGKYILAKKPREGGEFERPGSVVCPMYLAATCGRLKAAATFRDQAAPMARRCWKHSRQKTGRPWVGRKGTVVSLPHWEQLVLVSARIEEPPPLAPLSLRLALQALQRLGSFLKPLSAQNICSPAVQTNSAPHSAHFRTLSWYSIEPLSLGPKGAVGWAHFAPWAWEHGGYRSRGEPRRVPWACGHEAATETQTSLP